uniref:Putative bladder cancer-associated protein n=1 Tax=Phlebotomus kandelakii TaxID=1109342 RepID=A0A6B2E5B0_9DIPT
MYCLQCLLPVLLIPRPANAAFSHTHFLFVLLYLVNFFLERKPCTICSVIFITAVFLLCYSGIGNCFLWPSNCDAGQMCDNG